MDKRKLLQALGRRLLIVLLLVFAVLLCREAGYFTGLRDRLYPESDTENAAVSGAETAVAGAGVTVQPLAAVVCTPQGGRFGAAYEEASVMAVFRRFSADLGEALGSAGTPEPMTEQAFFENCLSGCGVLFRFVCPQPLELLTACLGAEMTGEAAAQQAELLFLRAVDDGTELWYRTEDREYYRCTTAVPGDGLRSHAEEYSPNGAYFAYENELLSGCDGCTVLTEGRQDPAAAECSVVLPTGTELDELLRAMGMNSYLSSSYTEADGTAVFLDEESTLRLSPSGSLYFRRSAFPENPGASGTLAAAVSTAWLAAERSIGKRCGDAELLFAGATRNETQHSVTVLLDYVLDGIPVQLSEGHAGELVIREGRVIQARLNFRRCTLTEETRPLLPALQAAAIAAAEDAGACMVYADSGETMNCIWVRADG